MASKVMLEATQAVVNGNDVAVHSGELFEPGAKLPDGVTVRPVIVDVPDEPVEEVPPVITRAAADGPAKTPAKTPAK